ncbi:MAG TPA: hypothetical protein VGR82_14530 [Methylomirabilota bacterium]|jgi:hypothetical protein|nr:hypothetical protein [Methylomirabilota bacterium]
MSRGWGALALAAALSAGTPTAASAQMFVAGESRPEFTIGPLFVTAVAPVDAAAPVNVTISFNIVLAAAAVARPGQLALLWPAEIAAGTAPGAADPALVNYVESRGFATVASGRLALRARDQAHLGLPTPADLLPVTASFVSYVRRDAPPQAGSGSLVWLPSTPKLGDARWVLNLTLPVRGMIGPKPATWVEEVFWGRRNVLSVSWGDVGSIAFYPLYHEHRDRIVHLAREYSRLLVNFPDADHLRIESIEPPAAGRRGSRLRAGTETVTVALNTTDDATPQTLKVQYAYYRGVFSWRPILISIGLLVLGNVTGLLIVSGQVSRFVRAHVRLGRSSRDGGHAAILSPERLAEIRPGHSTYEDVLRVFGPPDEHFRRIAVGDTRTVVYRATRRIPEHGLTLGWLATVRSWDIERHEVEIDLDGDVVKDVLVRVRRVRSTLPE